MEKKTNNFKEKHGKIDEMRNMWKEEKGIIYKKWKNETKIKRRKREIDEKWKNERFKYKKNLEEGKKDQG